MHESWMGLLLTLTQILTLVAAFLLLLFTAITTVKWVYASLGGDRVKAFKEYRRALGRTILIGLEVLLAATILKTLSVDETLESLGILLAMVAIRTIIGWTTSLEMNGRWPWQAPK